MTMSTKLAPSPAPVYSWNRSAGTLLALVVAGTALYMGLLRPQRLPASQASEFLSPATNMTSQVHALKIVPRLSHERENADHGWLKTFHSFNVERSDPQHEQFGSLRVINEDRVDPGTGFGLHTHREFEIFSYVVSGALEHKDSMGNTEILRRGDLQLTSAGTGIRHSEHQYGAVPVHFLQIWAMPHTRGLPPRYFTRHIGDEEKKDKWAQIVAPVGEDGVVHEREGPGPAPVQSGLRLAAAVISPGTKLMHTMPTLQGGRKVYVHITQSSGWNPRPAKGAAVQLSGTEAKATLREGDGAYIHGVSGSVVWVENIGNTTAEVLLFDLDL